MKRDEILNEAKLTVNTRNVTYGEPENNFKKIADLWSAYLDYYIDEHDVALMMCLFKIARASAGFSVDNYVDLCGYGACAGEVRFAGQNEEEIAKHLPFSYGMDAEDGEENVFHTDLTDRMDDLVEKVMEMLKARDRQNGKDTD